MDSSGIVSIIKTTLEGNESVGTGFLIKGSSRILTCYHVLKKAGCYSVGNHIGFMFEGQSRVIPAYLGDFDTTIDVAIINTDVVQTKGYYLSSSGKYGDIFDTLGFPEGSLSGVTAHPSFERKSPDKLIELKNANDICQGFSGAPLLDEIGSVVGMIRVIPQSVRKSGSMLYVARAIPIETIIEKFPDAISTAQYSMYKHTINSTNLETKCLSSLVGERNEINSNKTIDSSNKTGQIIFSKSQRSTDCQRSITTKNTDLGWQSQDIDNVARETFINIIQAWLDKTGTSEPFRLVHNSQIIDIVIDLPSMQTGISSIQTFWQIKSSSQKLKKYLHPEFESECFHLHFPQKTISSLKETLRQHEYFYLVFAHNPSNAQSYELYQRTPQERFEWYCVDLCQQLAGDVQQNYIVIPDCNKFNLSTFSLLWSSLWVEKFYCPQTSIEIPNLMEIIRLTHPYKNECFLELEDWNILSKKLSFCERELGKTEYSKIAFPIGIGYALKVINKKLYDVSSNLTTIQNYCPESLYGMANLWLFSRSYHGFMTTSGQVVTEKHSSNIRILPLPDNPQNISGLIKACLWHIVLLYSSLNVEVRIIYRPSYDAGTDHSYYGGGIGYFPWLSLSDNGVTWMMEESVDMTNGQHRDFINEHMSNLYFDPYHSNLWEVANSFNLHTNDLLTASKCPIKLFPKQSRFIEYPYLIFGNYAFRSLNSVRLKLS